MPVDPWVVEELARHHQRRKEERVLLELPEPDYRPLETCPLDGTPVSLAEGVCRMCGNAVGNR